MFTAIKKKVIKKIISVLIIVSIIILNLSINFSVYASEPEVIDKDIIFVLDKSRSMNYKDSNNLANEFVKMYIDTLDSENTRVGLVGFNDTIVSKVELTSLNSAENRNYLKNTVNQMPINGNTDIGLALKEATLMLEDSKANEKIIVLLSDGETDLNYSKIRTMEQSKSDEDFAINTAIEKGYNIYTVGINVDDLTYLNDISSKANGATYQMNTTEDLYNVFERLSVEHINQNLKALDTITINGIAENVSFETPNEYVKENNIVVAYDKPLSSIEANGYDTYKSKYYSSLKLKNNISDSVDFKIVSNGSTQIHVYYNLISSLQPVLSTPQKISDNEYKLEVKVFDTNTNEEINKEYYKNLEGTVFINENGTLKQVELNESENGFVANINIDEKNQNSTDIYVSINNGESIVNSQSVNLSTANNQPVLQGSNTINILLNQEDKVIDLNKYFDDIDDDILSYEIISADNSDISNLKIDENIMSFNTTKEGIENVEIMVSDGNGGYTKAILSLSVMPFWIYHKKTTLIFGLGLVLLLLVVILFMRRKEKAKVIAIKEDAADTYKPQSKEFFKNGRIEGYFLATKSGKDYPALFWNENHLANKSLITLGELLSFMEIDENLMESRKIFFEATDNETITFWHRTKCTIYIANKQIESGKQVKLNYDQKMYIVFEDGETEIEIRYKRVVSRSLV